MQNSLTRVGLFAVCIVLVLALLTKWSDTEQDDMSTRQSRKIKSMMKHAAQYQTLASRHGNQNPVYAFKHACQGLANVHAVRSLCTDKQITSLCGLKPSELIYYLEKDQDYAVKQIFKQTGEIPQAEYAVSTGWV